MTTDGEGSEAGRPARGEPLPEEPATPLADRAALSDAVASALERLAAGMLFERSADGPDEVDGPAGPDAPAGPAGPAAVDGPDAPDRWDVPDVVEGPDTIERPDAPGLAAEARPAADQPRDGASPPDAAPDPDLPDPDLPDPDLPDPDLSDPDRHDPDLPELPDWPRLQDPPELPDWPRLQAAPPVQAVPASPAVPGLRPAPGESQVPEARVAAPDAAAPQDLAGEPPSVPRLTFTAPSRSRHDAAPQEAPVEAPAVLRAAMPGAALPDPGPDPGPDARPAAELAAALPPGAPPVATDVLAAPGPDDPGALGLPGPRRPVDPDWLTFVPASAVLRSVTSGTAADVLPRGSLLGRRRVRAAIAVAVAVAVVTPAAGAFVATGTAGRLVARVGALAAGREPVTASGPTVVPPVGDPRATATSAAPVATGTRRPAPSAAPVGSPAAASGPAATAPGPTGGVTTGPIPGATPGATPGPAGDGGGAGTAIGGSGEAAALRTLRAQRTSDLAGLSLDGRWTAVLASKYPGVSDPNELDDGGSHVFDAADILAQHLRLRRGVTLGTRVVLLLSTDYGQRLRVDGHPLWVTLAVGSFPSAEAVQTWCAARFPTLDGARLAGACLPRRLDTPVPLG